MKNKDMYAIISKANHKQNWKTEVPVDQLAKTDVASIIRRATAGQPVLGDPNRVFDGKGRTDDVNPGAAFSWDLDNVNELMRVYNAKTIEDLQAKLAEQQEKLKGAQEPPAPAEPSAEPTK